MSFEEGRFRHYANQPFTPPLANTGSIDTNVAVRVANALEYIAAQLGDINRKLDTNATGPKNNADSIAAAAKRLANQI